MVSLSNTESADVVVIGGGILGCNAAYHLHQAGAGRVVLIEQAPDLATQTTAAGAGFVAFWGAEFTDWGALEISLERYAHQFYRQLGATHDIGLKNVGMVRLAVTPEGGRFLSSRYTQALTEVSSNEVALLSPEQIGGLIPSVNTAAIHAGLYWPTALRIDAPLATRALGRELQALGVEVRTGTTVTSVNTSNGRVSGVETSGGSIVTETVVNATGAWADRTAQMAGAEVVCTPLLTWRFLTEPIPGLPADLPMMFFSTHIDQNAPDVYIREHQGGLLIGAYPPTAGDPLSYLRQVPPDAVPGGLTIPPDLIRFADDVVREFVRAWPLLGTIQLKSRQVGLPAYTPDGRHLLGPVADVQGFT